MTKGLAGTHEAGAATTGGNCLSLPAGAARGGRDRQVSGAASITSEFVSGEFHGGKYGINDLSLERLKLPSEEVTEAQEAWGAFLANHRTKEEAGEAVYTALFEASPVLQSMLTTAKAVQAMKFVSGIDTLVKHLGDPAKLLILVETLGFQHLHLDIFPQRVVVFRDALLDLLDRELEDKFSMEARDGLVGLLNYVGGGIIYVRTHYARRLDILIESWTAVQEKSKDDKGVKDVPQLQDSDTKDSGSGTSTEADSDQLAKHGENGNGKAGKKNEDGSDNSPSTSMSHANVDKKSEATKQGIPSTFQEMFSINAAVMGVNRKHTAWMGTVIDSWDNLVMNVKNSDRIKEETDVLALRLSKYTEGSVSLDQFRACMLAALRSLLPKIWSTAHEEAWTWFWENMSRMVQVTMDSAPKYETSLEALFDSMDEAQRAEMRRQIYERFFKLAPAGQNYFKQSNTRLNFIAARIISMTLELCKNPKKMVSDISALGLRHVGFGIPTDLVAPFVTASVEVLCVMTDKGFAIEAFRWALGLIAKILVRTILEGSTVVMKAINANSPKMLKKALTTAKRRDRATWLLDIQVGDQHISPLAWSIESGSLKVADAILRDLLTIRADRARYYYGVDDLFEKHSDIVKRLCEEAPVLIRTLLDGLIWRSHRTENGMRRVHYFVKHMLVKPNGNFSETLKWISSSGDPAIVSHPIVATMADTLWSGVVRMQFIYSRMWNMFSLIVFILSQEILPGWVEDGQDQESYESYVSTIWLLIFVGRLFNYIAGMGRLACFHLYRIWVWCRNTMRRIIEEIDTDGNGSIDYAEMMQALDTFKDTVKEEIRKMLRVLRDDDGPGTHEDARRAIASQEKNMYNLISFVLMLLLAIMCTQEPMFWCSGSEDWPTTQCPAGQRMKYTYSICAMLAMIVHWLILIDLAVFSTEISAFLLVCSHVLSEVKQFLIALGFLLLTFGSAISIQCRSCPDGGGDFSDMPNAIISLFAITVGLYQGDFRDIQEEPMLLGAIFLFLTCSVVLLLNLLIAQLNRSYEYIYQDMLGFARLNRAALIVDAMESVSRKRWRRFVATLHFDEKMEFDQGDLGLPGGVQSWEPAAMHRLVRESILRFGGSTSPDMPWPEDLSDVGDDRFSQHDVVKDDSDDRMERIEGLVMKTLRRIERGDHLRAQDVARSGDNSRSMATASRSVESRNKFSSAVQSSAMKASDMSGSAASQDQRSGSIDNVVI